MPDAGGDVTARVRAYLEDYPHEITTAEDPETVYDRYHAPGYVLVNDGLVLDRDRMLAHIGPARRRAAGVRVQVHDVVCAGDRFAARYTLEATMRKRDAVIATEIHVFGELADDGRVRAARQLTRDVSPLAQSPPDGHRGTAPPQADDGSGH